LSRGHTRTTTNGFVVPSVEFWHGHGTHTTYIRTTCTVCDAFFGARRDKAILPQYGYIQTSTISIAKVTSSLLYLYPAHVLYCMYCSADLEIVRLTRSINSFIHSSSHNSDSGALSLSRQVGISPPLEEKEKERRRSYISSSHPVYEPHG